MDEQFGDRDGIVRSLAAAGRALAAFAADAVEAMKCVVAAIPPAGTPDGDLLRCMLLCGHPGFPEHLEALDRTAGRIPWRIRTIGPIRTGMDRAVEAERERLALSGESRPTGGSVYDSVELAILREAVVLVLADRFKRQTLRTDRTWVTGDDGQRLRFPPNDLSFLDSVYDPEPFWIWLRVAVTRAANAILMDRFRHPDERLDEFDHIRTDASLRAASLTALSQADDLFAALASGPEPLLNQLLTEEEREEATERVRQIRDHATPRQSELMDLLAQGMTIADAARTLGISPSTARVQMKLLRDKST
jgi:DNA-binding CsgD family transcriptional regulator